MDAQSLTFNQLTELIKNRSESTQQPRPSSLPNLASALRGFAQQVGRSPSSLVGATLRGDFKEHLSAHVEQLLKSKASAQYIANRTSLLRTWRRLLLELDRESAASLGRVSPLQSALQGIFLGGRAVKPTATAAGVPLATLRRWLLGARPNARSVRGLTLLERHLALPAGTLRDLVEGAARPREDTPPAQVIAYRERLRARLPLPYRPNDASGTLRQVWSDYLAFKTSPRRSGGGMQRQRHGRWSTTPLPASRNTGALWFAMVGAQYCATANVQWSYIAGFLGWLQLPGDHGGAGLCAAQAQSLANLANESFIERYAAWRQAASGGIFHGGITSFLKVVASVCHPETGFLTQQPERFADDALHSGISGNGWRERCAAARACARELVESGRRDARPSRTPLEPLASVLALDNPLDAIAAAVAAMNAARPLPGGVLESVWARDRILLKLLASNPLRAKNVRLLTFSEHSPQLQAPSTGSVLYRSGGGWRIHVASRALKNSRGAGRNDYDAPVRPELTADIDEYLLLHRPRLSSGDNPYFFVSKTEAGPMQSLNKRFAAITRRYIPNCPGFGPHGMRHIVASAILKAQPNGWSVAAWVLHDREATVRAHYAHLSSNDAVRWLAPVLDGPFGRM